jgi:hypothetical protein
MTTCLDLRSITKSFTAECNLGFIRVLFQILSHLYYSQNVAWIIDARSNDERRFPFSLYALYEWGESWPGAGLLGPLCVFEQVTNNWLAYPPFCTSYHISPHSKLPEKFRRNLVIGVYSKISGRNLTLVRTSQLYCNCYFTWRSSRAVYRNYKKKSFIVPKITTLYEVAYTSHEGNILSRVLGWLIRRGLDWIIGFIDTLCIQLGTTGNYSGIADLHTLQFTVAHGLGFSVFSYPGNGFIIVSL